MSELKYHDCRADSSVDYSWIAYDAQGIPLQRVCAKCERAKLSRYRPEILSGYDQGDVDEPIEPEPVAGGWGDW